MIKELFKKMSGTANELITCGLCGAFCLKSVATTYTYDGSDASACPRCWQGIQEHSGQPTTPASGGTT